MDERNTFYPASPTSDGSLAVDDVYARPHKSAFTNGIDHHLNEPESARKRRSSKGRSKSRDRQELEIILLNEKVDTLRKELENERRQRNDELKNIQRTLQRVYQDCAALTSRDAEQLLELDNRVDSLSSRYRADHNDLNALKRRVETIEDVAALLRSRIEAIEQQPPQQKHHSTSTHDDVRNSLHRSGDASSTQSAWGAQIIWVISAARPNVFEVDGVAYLKLQSRSTRNKVYFTTDSSLSFFLGIESSFPSVLRGRKWMPLASHKTSDDETARITLDRLPMKMRDDRLWSRQWLEEHCMTYDSSGKPHIYIVLQEENLTLNEINGVFSTPKDSAKQDSSRVDSAHHDETRPTNSRRSTPVQPATTRTVLSSPSPAQALQSHPATTTTPTTYTRSAPVTARVSSDMTDITDYAIPALSRIEPTPAVPGLSHPAFRDRKHSLNLQALPQYDPTFKPTSGSSRPHSQPLTPSQAQAYLSQQTPQEALLQHQPQPGLPPIMAGGTDEASSIAPSSVAAGGIYRTKSTGAGGIKRESHSQKILRQMQERQIAEQQQQMLMQQREAREQQQRRESYQQQQQQQRPRTSARSSVSHVQQLQSAQTSRPGSAQALSRYSSGTGGGAFGGGEDASRTPRKKKSFGRLVDRLRGIGRNSMSGPERSAQVGRAR